MTGSTERKKKSFREMSDRRTSFEADEFAQGIIRGKDNGDFLRVEKMLSCNAAKASVECDWSYWRPRSEVRWI